MTQPIVDTVRTLEVIQRALTKADITKNESLRQDAESVLSALVLVLKHRRAKLMPGVRHALERIERA